MIRTLFASAAAAVVLSSAALAQDAPTVKDVKVEAEIATIQNPLAASYWTNIAPDLTNAILARVSNQIADDGVNIIIDISEVELSNGVTETMNIGDTRLIGTVKMTHDTDNSRFDAYEMEVNVEQAKLFIPADVDVTVLPADSDVYYKAMIDTFAQGVVDRLK